MKDKNNGCPCRRKKCERHGDCESCREYHRAIEKKYSPACEKRGKNA